MYILSSVLTSLETFTKVDTSYVQKWYYVNMLNRLKRVIEMRKRQNKVQVMLTDVELEAVKATAESIGLPISSYIRQLLLQEPLVVDHLNAIEENLGE